MRRKEREIADINEIESIILKSDVCRIAFANDNFPYIVTMNFGYTPSEGRRLYFHCAAEGKKLDMISINNYVCFEFDTGHTFHEGNAACDYGMSFQSVVGYGHLNKVIDDAEKEQGLNIIMEHYTGRNNFSFKPEIFNRTVVLRLDISEMTGKKRCL